MAVTVSAIIKPSAKYLIVIPCYSYCWVIFKLVCKLLVIDNALGKVWLTGSSEKIKKSPKRIRNFGDFFMDLE